MKTNTGGIRTADFSEEHAPTANFEDQVAIASDHNEDLTVYLTHPALKLRGAEKDADLSSPSLSEEQVIIAANISSSVTVQVESWIPYNLGVTVQGAYKDESVRRNIIEGDLGALAGKVVTKGLETLDS